MNQYRLRTLLTQVNQLVESSNYTAWLTGRSVYDVDRARDVDIRLTGTLDVITLAPLLEQLAAMDNIDACWVSDLVTATRAGHCSVECVLWYPSSVPKGYTRLGKHLIQSNYAQLNLPLKSHQRRCLEQHDCFPCVALDKYLINN